MDTKRIIAIVVVAILTIIGLFMLGSVVENVDAKEIMVVQDPIDGELHWFTNQGIKWQWFGKVTTYLKRGIYMIEGANIMFNDAGTGTIKGSIQYDMPLDVENLTKLHTKYGSQEAIADQVIKRSVDKVIYMTGPMMSSRESYAEKRTDLINYVQDQIKGGVYKVTQRETEVTDQISGKKKSLIVAEVVVDSNGLMARQERSIVGEFGIEAFNFAIEGLEYSQTVQDQITQQQSIAMDVQTAIAESRKAEQRKLTIDAQGAASAATARWEQEVIKAKAVTEAQQKLEVATLGRQEAEQTKQKEILLGEGEATRKRLVMSADGALKQKLDVWLESQKVWAEAIKGHQGPLVPNVVMGGEGGSRNAANTASDLVNLLTVKTAKELSLDMSVPKGGNQ